MFPEPNDPDYDQFWGYSGYDEYPDDEEKL